MSRNKEIFNKLCRSYTFTWIFAKDINVEDCIGRIKSNFEHYIGLHSVKCDWKPKEQNGQLMISGEFDSIAIYEHRLNRSLMRHDCGDFPMGFYPDIRKLRG